MLVYIDVYSGSWQSTTLSCLNSITTVKGNVQ